jgi:signal transduction histidine kinase/DNA-binding response OmpR family regulator
MEAMAATPPSSLLAHTDNRLQRLFELSGKIIGTCDRAGNLRTINEQGQRELSPTAPLTHCRQICVVEHWPTMQQKLLALTPAEPRCQLEVPLHTQEGARWFQWNLVLDEESDEVHFIMRDIHAQKQNADLLWQANEELAQRVQEIGTLNHVLQTLANMPHFQDGMKQVADSMTRLFNGQGIWIGQIELRNLKTIAHTFPAAAQSWFEALAQHPRFAEVQQPGKLIAITNVTQDPGLSAELRQFLQSIGAQSMLWLPLRAQDHSKGLLVLCHPLVDPKVGESLQHMAGGIAAQIAIAIENNNLYEIEQQQRMFAEIMLQETKFLYEVSRVLAESHRQESIEQVLQRYLQFMELDLGHIALYLPHDETRAQMVAICDARKAFPAGWKLLNPELHRRLLDERQPLMLTEARGEALLAQNREWLHGQDIHSQLYCPMNVHGQVIGVLVANATGKPRKLDAKEIRLSQTVADLIGSALEYQRVLETAQQARQEAEAANQAKSKFLATMSHELRTPLNGILGYAQILRNSALNEGQQRGVTVIEQSGNHLLRLITDILDFAKLEAGNMGLESAPAHLPILLQSVGDMVRLKAERKGLRYVLTEDPSLPKGVFCDERKLRQVLINLLTNAVKFTDRGEVRMEILPVTQATPHGDTLSHLLRFRVIDSGVGIAPEDQEQIFAPFQQVGDALRKAEGTGLGLSICQTLLHLMDSRLQVTSEVGKGSVFWFDLRLEETRLENPDATTQSSERVLGVEGNPVSTLIIDDHPENRQFVKDLLTPLNFELREAGDGRTGMHMALKATPQLILCDSILPDVDGTEVVRQLRGQQLGQTVMIAYSADLRRRPEDAKAAGANDFLHMPFETPQLLDILQAHLPVKWRTEAPVTNAKTAEQPLVAPDKAILQQWLEAMEIGDVHGLRKQSQQLVEQDPRFHPFALEVQQMAQNFQLEDLKKFLTSHL